MTESYRMFVELPNGAKFRAHGAVSDVRTDVERFYELLLSVPASTTPTPKNPSLNGTTAATPPSDPAEDTEIPGTTPEGVADTLSQQMVDRLFARDRNGTVSLRALPQGENAESNALLALIYGSMVVGGEAQVTGSRLMKAAVQSGLQLERIDRSLSSAVGPFVTTAGFKKGRKYGLTNPGIRRAEEILKAILN